MTPKCRRCGKPAQKYGGIGAYSVQCEGCNREANAKGRARSAKRRAMGLYPPSRQPSK